MIDWLNLLYNTLWVVALSIALAAVSAASWRASVGKTALRVELARSGAQSTLRIAGLLFSLGLGLSASSWWERAAWLLFAVYVVLLMAWPLIRNPNRETNVPDA